MARGILAKVELLLEQHSTYDLGDGWSISKRQPERWCIYFQGKHIDCWEAENYGKPIPDDSDLTTFQNAVAALAGAYQCRCIDDWPDEGDDF